jgi:hypothetical protein
LYQQALRRETVLRQELEVVKPGAPGGIVLERIRVLIGSYEDMARLFATANAGDDSLSHAGMLAADTFARFGENVDREAALRILKSLPTRFPASPLLKEAAARVRLLEGVRPPPQAAQAARPRFTLEDDSCTGISSPQPSPRLRRSPSHRVAASDSTRGPCRTRSGSRWISIERSPSHGERIEGPPRVFVDLPNTRAVEGLKDATIPYPTAP